MIKPLSLDVLVGVKDAGEREHGTLGKRPRGLQNLPLGLERDDHARVYGNLSVRSSVFQQKSWKNVIPCVMSGTPNFNSS